MTKTLNSKQEETIKKEIKVIQKEYPLYCENYEIEFSKFQYLDVINDDCLSKEVREAAQNIADYVQNIISEDMKYWKVWIDDEYEPEIFWKEKEDF